MSLISSLYTSQKAIEASERLKKTNEALIKINEKQESSLTTIRGDVDDLKKTILCIGKFYSTEDRTGLKIISYNPCQFEVVETKEVITQVFPTYVSNVLSPVLTDGNSRNAVPSSPNSNPPKKP